MGRWWGIFLLSGSALADCPLYLYAVHDAQKIAALTDETAPTQRTFRNYGGYLDYFTTPDGDEVMFGAMVRISGKVLTLSQITILPLGASDYSTPVKLTVGGVKKAKDLILAKAKAAGFHVLVLEGNRITGARKKNDRIGSVSHVLFID